MPACLLALVLVLSACHHPMSRSVAPADDRTPYVLVLGTAQDAGLPQIACDCANCARARVDPRTRRLTTSLALVDPRTDARWLFDATPHLPEQIERLRGHAGEPRQEGAGRPALFDGVFITHAHMGHYAGLVHLGREAYGSEPTSVIGTSRLLDFLTANGPWSLLFQAEHATGRPLEPGETLEISDDLAVTALDVPHRGEYSDTVAFVIEGPNHALLYLPDIDKWERWTVQLEDVLAGVDFALLDGTFFGPGELPGREMSEVPHPFIVETMECLGGTDSRAGEKIWFTHLNHSNPAARRGSEARRTLERAGFRVLEDGAVFGL